MKPRLQSAVMTPEDWDAWHFLGCTSNDEGLGTIDFYEQADRRDAELMLLAGLNPGYSLLALEGAVVQIRGWDFLRRAWANRAQRRHGFNISNCA